MCACVCFVSSAFLAVVFVRAIVAHVLLVSPLLRDRSSSATPRNRVARCCRNAVDWRRTAGSCGAEKAASGPSRVPSKVRYVVRACAVQFKEVTLLLYAVFGGVQTHRHS